MLYLSYSSRLNFFGYHLKLMVMIVLLLWFAQVTNVFALEKQTIGWLEDISISKNKVRLKAKIDTGAKVSSLNAKIIKKFKRDKQKWVRFRIQNEDGKELYLERRVLRTVKIKRKLAFSLKRPVITLGICLGKVYRELEVNLANRENFEYPVLIGRNYLKSYFLVDASLTHTTKPSCK